MSCQVACEQALPSPKSSHPEFLMLFECYKSCNSRISSCLICSKFLLKYVYLHVTNKNVSSTPVCSCVIITYITMIYKNNWPVAIKHIVFCHIIWHKFVIKQIHCKICFLYNKEKLHPYPFPTCIYNFLALSFENIGAPVLSCPLWVHHPITYHHQQWFTPWS